MDHAEKARELFLEGYNCSQSVFLAFHDLTGLGPSESARIASSFGGGMGRLREVCGAVSGAFMVLGLLRGYDDPKDAEAKAAHYAMLQDFADEFREKHGSIICRDLLSGVKTTPGKRPEERTKDYYESRPCLRYVSDAAGMVDEYLKNRNI